MWICGWSISPLTIKPLSKMVDKEIMRKAKMMQRESVGLNKSLPMV